MKTSTVPTKQVKYFKSAILPFVKNDTNFDNKNKAVSNAPEVGHTLQRHKEIEKIDGFYLYNHRVPFILQEVLENMLDQYVRQFNSLIIVDTYSPENIQILKLKSLLHYNIDYITQQLNELKEKLALLQIKSEENLKLEQLPSIEVVTQTETPSIISSIATVIEGVANDITKKEEKIQNTTSKSVSEQNNEKRIKVLTFLWKNDNIIEAGAM